MGNLDRYERDDPTFAADLKSSDAAVIRVALWLRRCYSNHVHLPPLRVRPTVEEMAEYGDGGDLFISKDGVSWKRIEVAVRALAFTSAKDFPYRSIIVDAAHRWDRADPKPYAYIRLNKAVTHAAIISAATAEHWKRTTRRDAGKQRDRTFLECPIEHVQFVAPNNL